MKQDSRYKYQKPQNRDTPLTEQELDMLIKEATVSPMEEVLEAPVCLQVVENDSTIDVCTLGNFSLAIGKPKSRKTFLTTLLFAIVTGHKTDKLTGILPPDRNTGIYFDTEQSRYHVLKLLKRICKLTGKPVPENIVVISLRKYPPDIRRQIIERAIYSNDKIGFAVIDGIRDLVTSINDEEQATMITSNLLRWTEERNIHIMTVLHQNKGDNNARGHVGSELVNKAEIILSITKNEIDNSMSVVEQEYGRDKDFMPFAFTISIIDELPEIVDGWEKKGAGKRKVDIIADLGDDRIYHVLSKCFSKNEKLMYAKLKSQFKDICSSELKESVGDNKVKDIITYCKDKKWVIQEKEKGPYTFGL